MSMILFYYINLIIFFFFCTKIFFVGSILNSKNNIRLFSLGANPFILIPVIAEVNHIEDNRALVPVPRRGTEFNERLESFCSELIKEQNSFYTDFPDYDPNTPIFPVKLLNYLGESFKENISDILTMTLQKLGKSGALDIFQNKIRLNQKGSVFNKTEIVSSDISETIQEISNPERPLGDFGDQSLNDFIANILSQEFSIHMSYADVLVGTAQLISVGFFYKMLVNNFSNHVFPMSYLEYFKSEAEKKEWLLKRSKSIYTFMIFVAPVISLGVYKAAKIKAKDILGESKPYGQITESLVCLFSKNQNILFKRSISTSNTHNFNNSNLDSKIKYFAVLLTVVLLLISKITGFKLIFLFYSIISVFYLIYLILDFIIFLLFLYVVHP